MLNSDAIIAAIPNALDTLEVPGGLPHGTVRDFYVLPDGKRRVLIATDRLNVFGNLLGLVPYKGQILNQLSAWWFEQTADIIPNHFLAMPDPNVMITRETRPILLEVVARGYITGVTPTSLWTRYEAGEREIYGLKFPEGLKKNQALPQPVVTPSTKSTVGRNDRTAVSDVISGKYIDAPTWEKVQAAALALYQRGRDLAARGGLTLVDSKYEFGFDEESGALLLIDEIHTPDSSRYWKAESYEERMKHAIEPENFDRELARLWFVAQKPGELARVNQEFIVALSQRYQEVYELITGKTFQPAPYPAQPRIEASLAEYAY